MAGVGVRSRTPRRNGRATRRGSWCQPCNARGGPDHLTSETHRHRMASRDAVGPIQSETAEYMARQRTSARLYRAAERGTIYQNAQSAAWLAGGEYAQWLAGLDDARDYDPNRADDPEAIDCEAVEDCQDAPVPSDAPRRNGGEMISRHALRVDCIVAHDGCPIPPCPRCGRSDWSTPAGREWHVLRNPDCLRFRQPARHEYVTIGG